MPGKVFISYSREDADWLKRVTGQLGVLEAEDRLEVWDDTRIPPGVDWLPEIEQAIAGCDVALLLISVAFLNSAFIRRTEVPALLQRRAADGLCVIPVLVGPCTWKKVGWLARIEMPLGSTPLSSRRSKDKAEQALADLAELVDAHLNAAAASRPAVPAVDLHNLPDGAADFLGRVADLEWLDAQWQTAGRVSVAVLVAPGGTGKTSLLRRWLQKLKAADWGGAQRVFAYSFYRQGVSDASPATATDEPFLNAALAFFGVPCEAQTSAWERGRRLAQALDRQRALLVLDGVEPLQDASTHRLRTDGLKALLTTLADVGRQSLCVLSSRAEIADLQHYGADGALRCHRLDNLCAADGARLLHWLGVCRIGGQTLSEDEAAQDREYHAASNFFGGHALTLHILGLYLASRLHGDLRRLDRTALLNADAVCKTHPNHAFHVMHAYERWLEQGGEGGARQLAVLRLLGLFDRPATPDCVRALRKPPIPGLTDVLHGLSDEDWNALLHELQTAGLVQTAKWQAVAVEGYDEELAQKKMEAKAKREAFALGPPQAFTPPDPSVPADAVSLDAHPLLREYFAKRLLDSAPAAARAGHARLYEYLCASVPYWPEGEAGLAPLYQAVAHGCRAGRYQEACVEVYQKRINRWAEYYATKKLGLYGTDLSAVSSFFTEPWRTPVAAPALADSERAWLLAVAAFDLRALGRLQEAVEPMQATVEMLVAQQDWKRAAQGASNLSELQQTLGALAAAMAAGEGAVGYADASGDAFQRMGFRTTLAEARLQAGETAAALTGFAVAEALQAQWQPEYPRLYSLQGFRYCDALLRSAERTAWAVGAGAAAGPAASAQRLGELQAVAERAQLMFEWRTPGDSMLDIGLDHLTLARVWLYRAWLQSASDPEACATALQAAAMAAGQAVDGLRKAGQDEFIVRGLLTRACVLHGNGDDKAARADLDEAERIAERGGMKLFLADVHLHRARLFRDRTALDAARKRIDEIGYERRRGELDDAQCLLDGRAVVLPAFESVLAQARGENLPEPPSATAPTP